MINYVFDNPRRLKVIAAGLATTLVMLFVVLTLNRMPDRTQSTSVGPIIQGERTQTGLLPPSPAPDRASPTPNYGPSAPIALEAVQAFLQNDRTGLARLAQPEVMEGVDEAPKRPADVAITGTVKVIQPGPTRQRVQVPTTDGPMLLDMVVIDGAWKVMDMRYAR